MLLASPKSFPLTTDAVASVNESGKLKKQKNLFGSHEMPIECMNSSISLAYRRAAESAELT
jgi:hypothetical protein